MKRIMESAKPVGKSAVQRPFFILFALFLAIILFDLRDGVGFLTDKDDIVRLIQIRELLNGHHWSDMSLSAIAMPETYISHYSRLVDLPYFLISLALSPFMERGDALNVAAHVWPLVLLMIFARLSVYVFERLYGQRLTIADLAIGALVATMGVLEFTPGRIDHHNVLMVLMLVMLTGMFSPKPVGGLIAGVAMAFSAAIGLEVLPNVVLALAALSIHAILRPEISARRLSWTGLGLTLAALPAAIASYGPDYAFRDYCDTFANPWIASFVAGGLLLAAIPFVWRVTQSENSGAAAVSVRLSALAIPALMLMAAVMTIYPECLKGPYGSIDTLTKTLWLDRIGQERSIFHQPFAIFMPIAFLASASAMVLISAFPYFMEKIRQDRADFLIAIVLAAGSILFFFAYVRAFNYAAMFAMFLVPAAIEVFKPLARVGHDGSGGGRKWRIAACVAAILIVIALERSTARTHPELTETDLMNSDACHGADFSVLDTIAPGRIMAPLGLTTEIAEFHPQHTVEALSLHRAAPGIHRMLVAFISTDAAARKAALDPFDYLAVCARRHQVKGYDGAQLYTKLVNGEPVPGLDPVTGPAKSDFRVFRIDHKVFW